jgi:nuclear pore complex protein Nup98-Nup96
MDGMIMARSVNFRFSQSHSVLSLGQAILDYVHVVTRIPELQVLVHEQDDADQSVLLEELGELTGTIPKLIDILPKALGDNTDPRHKAAVAEVISSLLRLLDTLRPFASVCPSYLTSDAPGYSKSSNEQTQSAPTPDSGGTDKLRHINAAAYERFMMAIEVA